jgi:hypothetical protein
MTDEKDPKEIGEEAAKGAAADPEVPAVIVRPVTVEEDAPAPPAEGPSPISEAQAAKFEHKVEVAASRVQTAQRHTHEEHIDHVLTRGHPMKPAHSVRVVLAYGDARVEPENAPREGAPGLKPRQLLAEYETTAGAIHAAETLRDAGYKDFESHSPFPIHGMDAAMGLKDSRLGWIVLICGLTGVSCAWLLMYWTNAVDYPLVIGGKPAGALPSMVPIMFELTVLFSSFGAVFGMFGMNKLPQHHNVLFYSDRFAAFSNNKFFISVAAEDPKFDVERTRTLLEKTRPEGIELIETDEEAHS